MKAIQIKQFPGTLDGARSWLAVQQLWERHPEVRPQIAQSFKQFCQSVKTVIALPR